MIFGRVSSWGISQKVQSNGENDDELVDLGVPYGKKTKPCDPHNSTKLPKGQGWPASGITASLMASTITRWNGWKSIAAPLVQRHIWYPLATAPMMKWQSRCQLWEVCLLRYCTWPLVYRDSHPSIGSSVGKYPLFSCWRFTIFHPCSCYFHMNNHH